MLVNRFTTSSQIYYVMFKSLVFQKRIMNEVMCTVEDLRIKIYYQNTDSIHIKRDRINELDNEYQKCFFRQLILKDFGQFHNDFDEVNDEYIDYSIFNRKKMYYYHLINDKNETCENYLMKSVTLD